ncbi:hypothetical protein L596_013594 [Steinernema carpocapsae]|uniref:Uncharacterized protein n=2 Tax=Steinernema carpocapsae TaxID=34508 RepID=A0A4U5P0N6_STECR|nr:hypothetical protein L596_013594 [Steinernema carpocapsae]
MDFSTIGNWLRSFGDSLLLYVMVFWTIAITVWIIAVIYEDRLKVKELWSKLNAMVGWKPAKREFGRFLCRACFVKSSDTRKRCETRKEAQEHVKPKNMDTSIAAIRRQAARFMDEHQKLMKMVDKLVEQSCEEHKNHELPEWPEIPKAVVGLRAPEDNGWDAKDGDWKAKQVPKNDRCAFVNHEERKEAQGYASRSPWEPEERHEEVKERRGILKRDEEHNEASRSSWEPEERREVVKELHEKAEERHEQPEERREPEKPRGILKRNDKRKDANQKPTKDPWEPVEAETKEESSSDDDWYPKEPKTKKVDAASQKVVEAAQEKRADSVDELVIKNDEELIAVLKQMRKNKKAIIGLHKAYPELTEAMASVLEL